MELDLPINIETLKVQNNSESSIHKSINDSDLKHIIFVYI